MAQSLPRFCSRCGTEAVPNQQFCSKCGSNIAGEAPPLSPTQLSEQSAAQPSRLSSGPTTNPSSNPGLEWQSHPLSNPGLEPTSNAPAHSVPQRPSTQTTPPTLEPPSTKVSRPTLEPLQEIVRPSLEPLTDRTLSSAPDDAIESMPTQALPQVQKSSLPSMPNQVHPAPSTSPAPPKRPWNMKRVGIWLVLIVVLGGVVFGIVAILQALRPPSQPTITTTALGTTVNYAGVDVTVVNVQQSQSFLNDPNSLSDGMLRLQLRAQNKTSLAMNLPYETITHVTLPDGKVVGPTYVKAHEHVAPNATESGFVDFAVPQNVRVDQVIFQLGGVDEAQLDIPLNGHANVDQYASKTVHPNQSFSYYGLDWTLTDASLQFHIDGRQASKGMRYLILTLKVDNPLSQTAIPGSPYSYVQLKANNASINLINTTLPVAFDAGVSGKGGTVTFLVPQDSTSFVLTLSNPALDGFDASKPVAFQF